MIKLFKSLTTKQFTSGSFVDRTRQTSSNMCTRINLITIISAYCIVHTYTADTVSWKADTCPINIPEGTLMTDLHHFTADGAADYTIINKKVPGRFAISSSGTLSSLIDLDYESDEKSYTIQIMAFTASDPTVNATVICVINVTDVNDNPPKFSKTAYSMDTFNNVAINTTVLTVEATDKDVSATFNKVVYSIKDGENGVNFTINVNTGAITAQTVLTAPGPRNLTLTVVATDKNIDTFTAEASVRVCIGCKTSGSSLPQISLFVYSVIIFGVVLI